MQSVFKRPLYISVYLELPVAERIRIVRELGLIEIGCDGTVIERQDELAQEGILEERAALAGKTGLLKQKIREVSRRDFP